MVKIQSLSIYGAVVCRVPCFVSSRCLHSTSTVHTRHQTPLYCTLHGVGYIDIFLHICRPHLYAFLFY